MYVCASVDKHMCELVASQTFHASHPYHPHQKRSAYRREEMWSNELHDEEPLRVPTVMNLT